MEKTVEILSGKISSIEKELSGLTDAHNNTIKIYDNNFVKVANWNHGYRKFRGFVIVAGICGAYALYKQHKELKALKAKIEEPEKTEE